MSTPPLAIGVVVAKGTVVSSPIVAEPAKPSSNNESSIEGREDTKECENQSSHNNKMKHLSARDQIANILAEKIFHNDSNSSFASSQDTQAEKRSEQNDEKVEKKKSMKMMLLDYEVTEVETEEKLDENTRKIQVKLTLDFLLTTEVINFKTPLFILVEILKSIIFAAITVQNIKSCATFSPYVLLVSGLFIFPQIAVLWNGKLIKLLQILSYDVEADKPLFVTIRLIAIVGLFANEVLFAIATFWYMNTLTDVLDGVTSGLTMLLISNFDVVLLSQFTVYTTAFKTNAATLEKYFSYIYYSQYFFVIFFSGLLYCIAISIATSNHSGYQSTYCDDV